MEKFLEIYGALPRAGPGSNALTRRAIRAMGAIPDSPRILDVGCGPGMQTIELLRIPGATVVALDLLPQMIARVEVLAEAAGMSDRLVTRQQDMHAMDFPPASFDIVWSEGAIYLMGFAAGLEAFRRLVRPGGYIAVSEAVWLQPHPPEEAVRLWAEYPEIAPVEEKLRVIERAGLETVDHFGFPDSAWTKPYYDPMEDRIARKSKDWAGDPDGEAILAQARQEISVFRQYSDYYGYAFFVMRNSGVL